MSKKRVFGMIAAGIGAALVLTACTAITNGRQTITGVNGIAVQSQNFAPVKNEEPAPVVAPQAEPQTQGEEKPVAQPVTVEQAKSVETAKTVEQTTAMEKAPAQMMHDCSAMYGGATYDDE